MSNQPFSIARMGSKAFLDDTADMHNGKDYDWVIDAMAKLKTGEMTKKEMVKAMNITAPTLDKYIFIINLERVQQHGK